jgi:DNA-binding transcriptional regulator GbsR (MarR family)
MNDMTVENLDPLVQFIEDLGLSVEEEGMPRIAGRILGLLIVEEEPFHFDDIAQRLQVSRGSISTNTRLLEQLELIERFTLPGERKDFFRLAEGIHGRLLEKSLYRLRHRQSLILRCLDRLGSDNESARANLERMNRFYRLAEESTESFIDRWRTSEQVDDQTSDPATIDSRTDNGQQQVVNR